MSNLAEKLPETLKNKWQTVEAHSKRLAKRLDAWVETTIPTNISDPLRSEEGVNIATLKTAALAARTELVKRVRGQWEVIVGGGQTKETETAPVDGPAVKAESSPQPTKTPTAKKAPAKKVVAQKTSARKPPAKRTPAKKAATKKTAPASTPAKKTVKRTRKSPATKASTSSNQVKNSASVKKKTNNKAP